MSEKSKLFVNIAEWVLILMFGCFSLFLWTSGKKLSNEYEARKVVREQTLDAISDSIQLLKNKPTVLIYKYTHNGDTIYVNRKLEPIDDSIYSFAKTDGPVTYKIKNKAKHVSWYKINIHVDDQINTSKN